jgi:hypothetical protein
MEACTVWQVWRRVLREEPLQDAMFSGRLAEQAESLQLAPAERAVAEDYARNPAGTRFFITNYRYRMVSSFLNALETSAPLTHRLLRAHSEDLDTLATRFLDTVQWLDFGPYVYTYGGKILNYLLEQPDLAALHGLPELVAIEQAGVRITIDAADAPNNTGPEPGAYLAIGPLATVQCALDVSAWLRDGSRLGREPAPARSRWYLVYLRPPHLQRRIVTVPPLAVDIVEALRTPRSSTQLTAVLDDMNSHRGPADEMVLLPKLVGLGVVLAPAGRG